ncbi:hypothetical protein GCM10020258_20380 [Sphingomonas yabuuchiae]
MAGRGDPAGHHRRAGHPPVTGGTTTLSERLATTALVAAFATNLVLPIRTHAAILVSLANIAAYLGLPFAIAPRPPLLQSVDILVFHSAMILATPVGGFFYERVQKERFLLTLIQHRQSSELEAAVQELTRMSLCDPLTGAGNRRSLDARYPELWQAARTRGEAFSLILIDVDHFKLFNDSAGHAAGDLCLQAVTKTIAAAARCPIEQVTRCGGEEFALLVPGADLRVAEAVRRHVEAMAMPHPGLPPAASSRSVSGRRSSIRAAPPPARTICSDRRTTRSTGPSGTGAIAWPSPRTNCAPWGEPVSPWPSPLAAR